MRWLEDVLRVAVRKVGGLLLRKRVGGRERGVRLRVVIDLSWGADGVRWSGLLILVVWLSKGDWVRGGKESFLFRTKNENDAKRGRESVSSP